MKRYRIVNKRKFMRFISSVIIGALFIIVLICAIDFIRFPECYMPTWKYQLQNDIKNGNIEMIEYYERNYIANGRELFN